MALFALRLAKKTIVLYITGKCGRWKSVNDLNNSEKAEARSDVGICRRH